MQAAPLERVAEIASLFEVRKSRSAATVADTVTRRGMLTWKSESISTTSDSNSAFRFVDLVDQEANSRRAAPALQQRGG